MLRNEPRTPRQPEIIYPYAEDEETGFAEVCQICGEDADPEMGEFILPNGGSVVAHGGCGEDHGLQLA